MTAATPIIIPSMVKIERILLAMRDAHAIKKLSLYMSHLLYRCHIMILGVLYN